MDLRSIITIIISLIILFIFFVTIFSTRIKQSYDILNIKVPIISNDLVIVLKIKFSNLKNGFQKRMDNYFITPFSYIKFLKKIEKPLTALGIFGAIIAYLNSLVDTSTFNGSLTNLNNTEINNTIINATITAQKISPPPVDDVFKNLIKVGISTTMILFILISIYIVWEAIIYREIYENRISEAIYTKTITQIKNKFFISTTKIIEIQYMGDVIKRSSFIFLFSALISIFILYLLISYEGYAYLMLLLFVVFMLFLFYLISLRIILRTNLKGSKQIFYLYIIPVFWVCSMPFLLVICYILSVLYPSYQNILSNFYNTYIVYGIITTEIVVASSMLALILLALFPKKRRPIP